MILNINHVKVKGTFLFLEMLLVFENISTMESVFIQKCQY